MDSGVFISGISLVVAVAAALIAYLSLREQRRLTTNVTSYSQLATIELMIEKTPELLKLYDIDPKALEADQVTISELVYLSQSFAASEFYHRLAGHRKVLLTEYRKHLLNNTKVRLIWDKYIRGRFVSSGPFTTAIDNYIKSIDTGATSAVSTPNI